jgi:hypothetical protein
MAEAQQHGQHPHRPFSVTLVLLGVFLIGLANGWRALGLFRQSDLLLDLGAEPDPRLCAAVSVAWALLFLGLAYALWRRVSFTRAVAPVALLAFGLFQFVTPGPCQPVYRLQDSLPFEGIAYAAAVLFSVLALNLSTGRAYFKRRQSGS